MTDKTPPLPAEYLALGIDRDTFACIAVLTRREAERLAFVLAGSGVPVRISLAPPPSPDVDEPPSPRQPLTRRTTKRSATLWHVAVPGGLAGSPAAYIAALRGEPYEPPTCHSGGGQHPQAVR